MGGLKAWQIVAIVAAVIVAVLGAAATAVEVFSRDSSVEVDDIAASIQDEMIEKLDAQPGDLSVECPATIEWRVGEAFHCVAEDTDGTTVRVTVHMESKDGSYTWAVE